MKNSDWYFLKQRVIVCFLLLLIIFSTSLVNAAGRDKKVVLFLDGGKSYPWDEYFSEEVKAGLGWGAGLELRYWDNWALGFDFHHARFDHKLYSINSMVLTSRYVDWIFTRGNCYFKYLVGKGQFLGFFKGGVGLYTLERKSIYLAGVQTDIKKSGYSLVPGVGLEYSTKKYKIFIEADYNAFMVEEIRGCIKSDETIQFFDLFVGLGYCLPFL
jgi:hypothetical protein